MVKLGALGGLLLCGCVATAAPLPPRRAEAPPPPSGATGDAPERPADVPPNAAWVPGHWHWNGTENTWVPGRWQVPPGGATYAP
jgi:hypothetical protein